MDRRAGIYVRISKDREGAGLGVERQEKDCREKAAQVLWQAVDVYTDNDVSASDRRKKRKEYERLLADLASGRINSVIVWHMDRLHRQPAELERFIEFLDGRDVAIQTVKAGEVDPNSPSGKLVLRMLGAAARYEVEHKSVRIKAKHRELAEAGKVGGGGSRPFGFESDRKTVRESEAEELRAIAARVLNGASLHSIVRDLDERGVPTVNGTQWGVRALSGQWTVMNVRRMLLSPRNAGLRQYQGEVIRKAEWPAIFDQATHDALVRKLTDPVRRTNPGINKRKYLLSGGVLRCFRCGTSLISRLADRGYVLGEDGKPLKELNERGQLRNVKLNPMEPGYVCPGPRVPGKGKDDCRNGRLRIHGVDLDEFVARAVVERLSKSDRFTKALTEASDTAKDHAEAVAEVQEIDRLLDELEDDYRRPGTRMTRPRYERSLARLESRRDEAERRALDATGQSFMLDVPRDPKDLQRAWESAPQEWRWTLIGTVIDHIVIGPGRPGFNKFDPSRVTIKWKV